MFARSVLFQMFLLYQNEMFLNFLVILSDISTGQGHNEEVIVILHHLQRNSTMMIAWPNSFSTDRLYLFIHLVVHQTSSPSLDVSVSVLLLLPLWKNLFRDVGAGLLVHLLVPVIHLQQEAMCWLSDRSLGPYGAHQVSVCTTRAEKPGPFRRILMRVLGDWLPKEVPSLSQSKTD